MNTYKASNIDCPTCAPEIEKALKDPVERKEKARTIAALMVSLILYAIGILASSEAGVRQGILAPEALRWVKYLLFIAAWLVAGAEVLHRAFRNLARGRIFDENLLMTVSTLGAFAIGALEEAAAVMIFYQLGELLQTISVNASRRSIKSLLAVRPDSANLIVEGELRAVAPETVEPGSLILVRAGEKIPLDGRIEEGFSSLNVQALTGESLPRPAGPGDEVFSGTINITGLLRVRTEKRLSESAVSKILELVENASRRKAKAERFVTSFAKYYTPAVMGGAALLALVPPLIGAGSFSTWLYRALVMLVISCPCALVVSIPLGYFGGMGAAARKGILFKGGDSIDALAKLKAVAFDKTGTLTRGRFSVKEIFPAEGQSRERLLELAALAESESPHLLAASILSAYGKDPPQAGSEPRVEVPGKGVKVDLGGKTLAAGNDALLHELEIPHPLCSVPGTSVHVAFDGAYAGYIELADEPKPESRDAVAELHVLGLRTAMLSGDSEHAAKICADSVGIKMFRAGLLPGEKLDALDKIKAEWGSSAFVGDGINDAPVLAGADLGMAMGRLGSDAAIESADVVLMSDSLLLVPEAIRIAIKTRRIVSENVVLAIGVKLIFLAFGAFGLATMWEAVFADVGVALLAVMNAVRARRGEKSS